MSLVDPSLGDFVLRLFKKSPQFSFCVIICISGTMRNWARAFVVAEEGVDLFTDLLKDLGGRVFVKALQTLVALPWSLLSSHWYTVPEYLLELCTHEGVRRKPSGCAFLKLLNQGQKLYRTVYLKDKTLQRGRAPDEVKVLICLLLGPN